VSITPSQPVALSGQHRTRIARQVEYVELTLMEEFQQNLIDAIHIPHMIDQFPHLKKRTTAAHKKGGV
jgi:uncharacterized 2Fe-2S/4Fe-4S cluster protein (DUF4445 family)